MSQNPGKGGAVIISILEMTKLRHQRYRTGHATQQAKSRARIQTRVILAQVSHCPTPSSWVGTRSSGVRPLGWESRGLVGVLALPLTSYVAVSLALPASEASQKPGSDGPSRAFSSAGPQVWKCGAWSITLFSPSTLHPPQEIDAGAGRWGNSLSAAQQILQALPSLPPLNDDASPGSCSFGFGICQVVGGVPLVKAHGGMGKVTAPECVRETAHLKAKTASKFTLLIPCPRGAPGLMEEGQEQLLPVGGGRLTHLKKPHHAFSKTH